MLKDITTGELGPVQFKKWTKAVNRFHGLRGLVKSGKNPGLEYNYFTNIQDEKVNAMFNRAENQMSEEFPVVNPKNLSSALKRLEEIYLAAKAQIPVSENH